MSGISSALLIVLLLPADLVHLKNGGVVSGVVLSEDDEQVVVRVPGGQMTFARRDVARIEREDPARYSLREGERLIASGRYSTAARELRKALGGRFEGAVRERLKDALAGLFETRLREGLLDAAEASLAEITREYPEAEVVSSLRRKLDARRTLAVRLKGLSIKLSRKGEHARAAALAERAVVLDRSVRAEAAPYLFSAYVKLGDEALRRKDNERAYVLFKKAARYGETKTDALSPRLVSARVPRVLELVSAGRLREAEKVLDSLLDEAPASRAALYVKGRLLELAGKPGEASAVYARALSMEIAGGRRPELAAVLREELELALGYAREREPEQEPPGEWRPELSEHFKVLHQGSSLAGRVATAAEAALARAMNWLGLENYPETRIDIRLYPDSRSYVEGTGQPEWSGGVCSAEVKGLGLRAQEIATFATCQRLLSSVVPHEVGHVALNMAVGKETVPLALHEGFAIHMESAGRRNYLRGLARARLAAGKLLGLEELFAAKEYPEDQMAFYAQASSVFEFLALRLGDGKMRELLLDWAKRGAAVALKRAGFQSVEHLEEAWTRALE